MIHSVLIAMSLASAPTAIDPREAPAPAASPSTAAAAPAAKRYCITDTPTGTRMPKRICHTQSEWKNLGVDPTASN